MDSPGSSNDDGNEMMEIEIKYAKDRSDRILVHYGDDPEMLARDFVALHKLKPASVSIISNYIENTIQTFLERNEYKESDDSSSDDEESDDESITITADKSVNNNQLITTSQPSEVQSVNESISDPVILLPPPPMKEPSNKTVSSEESLNKTSIKPKEIVQPSKDTEELKNIPSFNAKKELLKSSDSTPKGSFRSISPERRLLRQGSKLSDHSLSMRSIHTPEYYLEDNDLDQNPKSDEKKELKPTSLDHALFQSNIDRNLAINNFSYKKIENEIVNSSSKPPNTARTVDSYHSPLPSSNTLSTVDSAASTTRALRTCSFDPDHYDDNADDIRESLHSISSTKSARQRTTPKSDQAGGRPQSTPNSSSKGKKEGIAFSPEMVQQLRYEEELTKWKEKTEVLNTNDDVSEVSSISERELMYNRMQNSWLNPGIKKKTSDKNPPTMLGNSQKSKSLASSLYDLSNDEDSVGDNSFNAEKGRNLDSRKTLKPTSNTLNLKVATTLSNRTKPKNLSDPQSIVGKSVQERLYIIASHKRKQKDLVEQKKREKEEKSLEENKYKLNKKSQEIVQNLRPTGYQDGHIGERLYQEGLNDIKTKTKRAKELKEAFKIEEWSCVRCGTFHKINKFSGVRLADVEENVTRTCPTCKLEQEVVNEFKPNVKGFALKPEEEEMLNNRWKDPGEGYRSEKDKTIHDYLYNNARHRENVLKLNKILWEEETNNILTFAPKIPESSQRILDKYKNPGKTDKNKYNISTVDENSSLSDSNFDGFENMGQEINKNLLAGPAVGKYFSRNTTERLSKTHLREFTEGILYEGPERHGIIKRGNYKHLLDADVTYIEERDRLPEKEGFFVNRLVYEYKEKDKFIEQENKKRNKVDEKTGQILYQPKVPEVNFSHFPAKPHTEEEEKSKKPKLKIHDEILLKDSKIKDRINREKIAAEKRMMNELKSQQIKPLENSEKILEIAKEKNAEELFHLLVELTEPNQKKAKKGKWLECELNISLIDLDLLVPEVKTIIEEVQHQAISKNEQTINFSVFKHYVFKSLNKRISGIGKSYVFAPKKKPIEALKLAKKEKEHETFHPQIDKTSERLVKHRYDKENNIPIEKLLQNEGLKTKEKWEKSRQEKIIKESKDLTFKPKLFKPPSYVVPKYRYIIDLEGSLEKDGKNEKVSDIIEEENKPTLEEKETEKVKNNESSETRVVEDSKKLKTDYSFPSPVVTPLQKQEQKDHFNQMIDCNSTISSFTSPSSHSISGQSFSPESTKPGHHSNIPSHSAVISDQKPKSSRTNSKRSGRDDLHSNHSLSFTTKSRQSGFHLSDSTVSTEGKRNGPPPLPHEIEKIRKKDQSVNSIKSMPIPVRKDKKLNQKENLKNSGRVRLSSASSLTFSTGSTEPTVVKKRR